MTTLMTTVRAGRIKFDEPYDLPDGSQVEVTLRPTESGLAAFGMTEEEQGTSAEEIQRWIAALEAVPAPVMTDEEWAAWNARRREGRELEFSQEKEREAKLFGALE